MHKAGIAWKLSSFDTLYNMPSNLNGQEAKALREARDWEPELCTDLAEATPSTMQ